LVRDERDNVKQISVVVIIGICRIPFCFESACFLRISKADACEARCWPRCVLNPPVQMLASEGINNPAVFIDHAFVAMEPSVDVKKRIDCHACCPWLAQAIICEGPSGSSQSRTRVSENFLGFFDHGEPRLSAVGPLFAWMVLVVTDDTVPPARWSARSAKR
jgi:hypothetical protein